jgi:hypothetical protein
MQDGHTRPPTIGASMTSPRSFARLPGATLGAAAIVLVLAGCGAIADKASETVAEQVTGADIERDGDQFQISTDEGSISVDGESGTFEMTTPDGQVSTGTGSLPEGFPADVPLIDGEVLMGSSSTTGGTDSYTVQVKASGGDPGTTFDDAVGELTRAGFTEGDSSVRTESGDGSLFATAELSDGTWDVVVGTIGSPAEHFVTYHVTAAA